MALILSIKKCNCQLHAPEEQSFAKNPRNIIGGLIKSIRNILPLVKFINPSPVPVPKLGHSLSNMPEVLCTA